MRLNDHSWQLDVEPKFRQLGGITFPRAIKQTSILWGAAGLVVSLAAYFVLALPLLNLLGLGVIAQALVFLALVGGITLFTANAATSKVAHGKDVLRLLLSRVRFRSSPKHLVDFRKWDTKKPENIYIESVVNTR